MRQRRITPVLAALLFVAGCSTSTATPGEETEAAPTITATDDPTTSEGGDVELSTPLPASCDITDVEIANFNRDWGRVAGGAGRPDWHEYTEPLVATVTELAERAQSCPGAEQAEQLVPLIVEINDDAQAGELDIDPINDFITIGTTWLEELGFGPNALSTG